MIRQTATVLAAVFAAAMAMGCGDTGSAAATGSAAGSGGSGGGSTTGSGGGGLTAAGCFQDIAGPLVADYDQYNPVIGSHCKGTNHQDITGIERIVFLGDSITTGTPPATADQFYFNVLTGMLRQKFGQQVEMQNCSEWGARNDDLLMGGMQIATCFPDATDPRRTLVVMTSGGNDIAAWAKDKLPTDQASAQADQAAQLLREGIEWFYADPARFPNGVFVVFANVYEYTDGTADLSSCPLAATNGLSGTWPEGIPAIFHFEEQYMKIAVETQTDMIFLLETFCGHGYHNDDMATQCYRGPNTPRWFDVTCIHPTAEGHGVIADLFYSTIDE